MKKLFFILIISVFCITGSQSVVAYRGDPYKNRCDFMMSRPELVMTTSYGELTYDRTKSIEELTAASGSGNHGSRTLGLASIILRSKVWLKPNYKRTKGGYCVSIKSLEVYIGYVEPTIYIHKDAEDKTCRYELIKRHEQAHQQINITTLEYFIPVFYKELKRQIETTAPRFMPDSSSASAYAQMLQDEYVAKIEKIRQFMNKEKDAQHKKLDSHYALEELRCRKYNERTQ